jgi:ElaB/YqjD/DUF883 family membrane-anchored ribosome-binding protein
MNTTVESAREAVSQRLAPALESLEQNVHDARRLMSRGRRKAEDLVDETALRVRERPLTSVALAAGAAALAGCMIGFALASKAGRGTRPPR